MENIHRGGSSDRDGSGKKQPTPPPLSPAAILERVAALLERAFSPNMNDVQKGFALSQARAFARMEADDISRAKSLLRVLSVGREVGWSPRELMATGDDCRDALCAGPDRPYERSSALLVLASSEYYWGASPSRLGDILRAACALGSRPDPLYHPEDSLILLFTIAYHQRTFDVPGEEWGATFQSVRGFLQSYAQTIQNPSERNQFLSSGLFSLARNQRLIGSPYNYSPILEALDESERYARRVAEPDIRLSLLQDVSLIRSYLFHADEQFEWAIEAFRHRLN